MKNLLILFACFSLFLLPGCISYTGAVMPGDDAVDEGNKIYAIKAANDYAQRQKFKREVEIS